MRYELYIQLPHPARKPLIGTLAADKDGAFFFAGEGTWALYKPDIVFINPDGIMLKGYEETGMDKTGRKQYKYQEWFCRYAEVK